MLSKSELTFLIHVSTKRQRQRHGVLRSEHNDYWWSVHSIDEEGAMTDMTRNERLGFITAVVILGMLIGIGHCTTTSSRRNSIGTVQYQENPFTYKVGSVVGAFEVKNSAPDMVVRVQPLATYSLFTEDILICGEPVDMLQGKKNPLVLTYETVAHRSVSGVGCHRLIRVDELQQGSR